MSLRKLKQDNRMTKAYSAIYLGRGNSLSCGAGWSTELDCGVDSKPAVVDNSSLNDNSYESSQSDNAELK